MDQKRKIYGINKKIKYLQKFVGKISLFLDIIRLQVIKHTHDSYKASKIRNDDKKIEALPFLENDYERATVAEEITDDMKKIKSLNYIENKIVKAEVASTISDDNIKIELWEVFETAGSLKLLANSLNILKEIKLEGKSEIFFSILWKTSKEKVLEKIKEQLNLTSKIKEKNSDDEKLEDLYKLDSEYLKSEVILTLKDISKKMHALSSLTNDESKANIIRSLNSDDEKIEALKYITDTLSIISILFSIQDITKKLDAISFLPKIYRKLVFDRIIDSLQDDDIQLDAMIKYADDYKSLEYYFTIKQFHNGRHLAKNEKFKKLINLLKNIPIIKKCEDDNKKIDFINTLENENLKLEIALTIKNKTKLKQILKTLKPSTNQKFRQNCDMDFVKENLPFFLEIEGVKPEKIANYKKLIDIMFETNNQVVTSIDFRLLDDKYIQSLGIDKINQITCYSEVQFQILRLNEAQLQLFSQCINNCTNAHWTPLAQAFLCNCWQYDALIENISQLDKEKIDYKKLNLIIQDKNIFEIKSIDDLENFQQIKKKKCNNWIKSDDIVKKKLAVLEKIFGQSIEYSMKIIRTYGHDIEAIHDEDLKDYIHSLNAILSLKDEKIIEEIYEKCEEVENIDKINIEEKFKNEYLKLYNEDLFKIEQAKQIEEGIYDAGTDFKIILTSLSAYVDSERTINNYKDDWNRPSIAAQHFCASYIRNDMISTAPISNICYRLFSNG